MHKNKKGLLGYGMPLILTSSRFFAAACSQSCRVISFIEEREMLYGSQLYSLRRYCSTPAGVEDTFHKIKAMGAETAQLSACCPMPAKELRRISEESGVSICGTHTAFDRIKNETEKVAEEHLIFGCGIVGLGSMPDEYRGNLEGLRRFEDFANRTAQKLAPFGLKFAYHNHHFEFKKENGVILYDHLIENTLPEVNFILDTYWVKFAGYDPCAYLSKLKGRAELIHLKDYKKILFLPAMKEVGCGTIDFPAVIAAAEKAGTRFAVAELDFSRHPLKSMEISLSYMLRNLRKE
jgi:sugar phosphate isomerase/epimerase